MHPRARTGQLVVQDLADETLVFDQRASKAHCLNRTTALVWKGCDGRNDLAGLARLVERELGIAGGEAVVQLALEQLGSRHLLEGPIERGSAAQRNSRRDLLKQLAAAAVLPTILTVAAPRANAAGSPGGPGSSTICTQLPDFTPCAGGGQVCCGGVCCPQNGTAACKGGVCCVGFAGRSCRTFPCCAGLSCVGGACQ